VDLVCVENHFGTADMLRAIKDKIKTVSEGGRERGREEGREGGRERDMYTAHHHLPSSSFAFSTFLPFPACFSTSSPL